MILCSLAQSIRFTYPALGCGKRTSRGVAVVSESLDFACRWQCGELQRMSPQRRATLSCIVTSAVHHLRLGGRMRIATAHCLPFPQTSRLSVLLDALCCLLEGRTRRSCKERGEFLAFVSATCKHSVCGGAKESLLWTEGGGDLAFANMKLPRGCRMGSNNEEVQHAC